jgi:hypothetical protein
MKDPKEPDLSRSYEPDNPSDGGVIDLSEFFKFPSLGRLFQGPDRTPLEEMRSRLTSTSQNLERVIRQGGKADADRAILISRSYQLALNVLEELDQHVARQ